jgi:hypothetical protein
MADERFQPELPDIRLPNIVQPCALLPEWLARRHLAPGEQVAWVRGPRLNPWWERHVTHPVWFLYALAFGAACLAAGWVWAGSWADMPPLPVVAAVVAFFGSVYVLAIAAAYFTRLVVTDRRLFILQGYEVCCNWGLNQLPPSLLRYGPHGRSGSPSVNLDTLQTMLGSATEQFADSKTILAFGKHLDRIKARDNGPP